MSTSDKNQNSVKRSSRNCTRRYRAESAVPTFWVENVFFVCFLIDRVELNGRGILVILRCGCVFLILKKAVFCLEPFMDLDAFFFIFDDRT